MASDDVIELGSSDEEALPPPPATASSKAVGSKRDAMVHIPRSMPGVTIKPARATKSTAKPTVRPVVPIVAGKSIPSGKIINQTTVKPVPSNKRSNLALTPGARHAKHPNINPMSLMRKLDKSQVVINKVSVPSLPKIAVVKSLSDIKFKQLPQLAPNPMARLPPSVTVTKTSGGAKRPIMTNIASMAKKQKPNVALPITIQTKPLNRHPMKPMKSKVKNKIQTARKPAVNTLNPADILTVELDDETYGPSSSTTSNPSWYLRPEDQANKDAEEMEKLNNAEPEPQKFIEICIEDSPISKPKNRRASELDNAITIDDSPNRHSTPNKRARGSESEDEDQRDKTPKHKKKKKLDYHTEVPLLDNSIEIEIDPIQVDQNGHAVDPFTESADTETIDKAAKLESSATGIISEEIVGDDSDKTTKPEADLPAVANETVASSKSITKKVEDAVIEILESPVKKKKGPHSRAINKPHSKQKLQEKYLDVIPEAVDSEEFHPVYQKFIDTCLELDNSSDMQIIVEKKIRGYYKQVPKDYTHSEDFVDMVSSKILSMKAGKEKMYLYIKDVVDELNVQRKMVKDQLLQKETEIKESGKLEFTDESEFDSKRQRQIRKLEKTIRKLHRAIQKLEEQEVDFDDEEDSVYLLAERYKERMVRVHAKLCQLTNTKLPSEPRLHIESRPGQPTGPAKRLEKWINKKVPMGKPLPFPDFHDVLRIVREANSEDKLGWNEADIMEEARDLFTRCGKKLQRRRQEVEWRIAASRLTVDIDPAEDSEDLKNKLERNRLLASKKEIDVFNKYADRQKEMRLEGEEIGDKEAEESPVESEDDDAVEEVALSDKEKRKERIKRLIQERTHKKSLEEKENSQSVEEVEITDPSTSAVVVETKNDKVLDPSIVEIDIRLEEPEPEVGEPVKSVEDENVQEKETNENNHITEKDKDQDNTKQSDRDTECENKNDKTDADTGETQKSDSHTKSQTSEEQIELHSVDDGSEVDELQLLEKLYSENDINSSAESSDLDSPIDISDTDESDDSQEKNNKEVISIENSSESDTRDSSSNAKHNSPKSSLQSDVIEEIESSNDAPIKHDDEENSKDGSENITDMPVERTSESVGLLQTDNDVTGPEPNKDEGKPNDIVEDCNMKNISEVTPETETILENPKTDGESLQFAIDSLQSVLPENPTYDDDIEMFSNQADIRSTETEIQPKSKNIGNECINAEDDEISIGETIVPAKVADKSHEMDSEQPNKDEGKPNDIVEDCNMKNISEVTPETETILENPKTDGESLQFAIDSLQSVLPDNPTYDDDIEMFSNQADIRSPDSEIQPKSKNIGNECINAEDHEISIGETIVQAKVADKSHEMDSEHDISIDQIIGKETGEHLDTEIKKNNETTNKSDETLQNPKEDVSYIDNIAVQKEVHNERKVIECENDVIFDQVDAKGSGENGGNDTNKEESRTKVKDDTISIGASDSQTKVTEESNKSECENDMSIDQDIDKETHVKTANKPDEHDIKTLVDSLAVPSPEAVTAQSVEDQETDQEKDTHKGVAVLPKQDELKSNEGNSIETTILISTQEVITTDVIEEKNDSEASNTSASKMNDSNDNGKEDLRESLV